MVPFLIDCNASGPVDRTNCHRGAAGLVKGGNKPSFPISGMFSQFTSGGGGTKSGQGQQHPPCPPPLATGPNAHLLRNKFECMQIKSAFFNTCC